MRTFKALLDHLNQVQGVPFVELAKAHGITWTSDPTKNKRLGGLIVEKALGVEPNPRAEADLTFLGLEIKTIPVAEGLDVLEHTKVTMVNFADVYDQSWELSTVYHKLRSILFVPIVKYDLARPDQWYIRSPFVWMPSLRAEAQLKQDYEAVRTLVKGLTFDKISTAAPPAGQGRYLIANTAGRDSDDKVRFTLEGKEFLVQRRAWMLRKSFTKSVIDENIRYPALGRSPPPDQFQSALPQGDPGDDV